MMQRKLSWHYSTRLLSESTGAMGVDKIVRNTAEAAKTILYVFNSTKGLH